MRLESILAAIVVLGVTLYGGTTIAADYMDHQPRLNPDPAFVTPSRPGEELESWTGWFDRDAAVAALGSVSMRSCMQPGGPTGSGQVKLTFAPDGRVTSAVVDSGAFAGTPAGDCIASHFRDARIPRFFGDAVTVTKPFTIY
jgi:hypothetical protein